jgi:hypothetical protein
MKVILGADPDQLHERICLWHPDSESTVFPLLLETTDGHFFRLVTRLKEIKPEDNLLYMLENYNPRKPPRIVSRENDRPIIRCT